MITFTTVDDVAATMRGGATGWKRTIVEDAVELASVTLSSRFPRLAEIWNSLPEDHDIRRLASIMVKTAARKLATNPEAMSSETMGPYAYSKFDSEDTTKDLFPAYNIKALEALLAIEDRPNPKPVRISYGLRPAKPMLAPGSHSRRYKWGHRR